MRNIQSFSARTDVQSALDNNELGKPYVALVADYGIDWNGLKKGGLPDNSFLCNYNAKTFNSATTTILKTEGQLFDEDLVLMRSGNGHFTTGNGYITFSGYSTTDGYRLEYNFPAGTDNIFARFNNETGKSLTVVYKTSPSSNQLLFNVSSIYSIYDDNFRAWNGTEYMSFSATTNPNIMCIRIYNNGDGERKCITTSQVLTATNVKYNIYNEMKINFLGSVNDGCWKGDFYWLYVSNETLTDAEIAKVIRYNENF